MQFMKLTSGAIAVISIQAAVQPTARDPYQFNELNLPLPQNPMPSLQPGTQQEDYAETRRRLHRGDVDRARQKVVL
ncbi:hypothetical protein CRV24_006314 [Beauveria bassiana]|nr:hypothetical protein CRV24_006314 [Beauveria bassiana]